MSATERAGWWASAGIRVCFVRCCLHNTQDNAWNTLDAQQTFVQCQIHEFFIQLAAPFRNRNTFSSFVQQPAASRSVRPTVG